ncbi:MAG TPA: hypothetical protein ENN39_06495 [Desulfonatronum sp.]|nr:hypothetical protein [Desulfonatronum sp.]
MSLRALALELYDLEKRVDQLTRALAQAAPEQHATIELKLLRTRAERDRLRAVLQAKKDEPSATPQYNLRWLCQKAGSSR